MPLNYPALPAGALIPYAGFLTPNGFLLAYGQTVSRTTYSALFAALCPAIGTFTVTIATPGVITLTAHGLVTGDQVYLTTTGALPTGLTANTLYYVIYIDANTVRLATTRANAYVPTPINTTGTQSGTHTLNACPNGLGDGSTTFTLPDTRGRSVSGADSMGGTAASRLTNASIYGNHGASGGSETTSIAHTHTIDHTHTAADNTNGGAYNTIGSRTFSGSSGAMSANATPVIVQPTLVANYIIKT